MSADGAAGAPSWPDTLEALLDFAPAARADWAARAERFLKGADPDEALVFRTADGRARPALPDAAVVDPALAASAAALAPWWPEGWIASQTYRHPDPAEVARRVAADAETGIGEVLLRLDAATRRGATTRSAEDVDGLLLATEADLDQVLDALSASTRLLAFEAGAAAPALLAALARRVPDAPDEPAASPPLDLGFDPLGRLAATGEGWTDLDHVASVVAQMREVVAPVEKGRWTFARLLRVDATPYHRAGAAPADELAFALATAAVYLRAQRTAGLAAGPAISSMSLALGVDGALFESVAKLRAARLLWARLAESVAGSDAAAARLRLRAGGSLRTTSRRDPWTNLLRGTAEAAAAVIGGADVVTVPPLDAAEAASTPFALRLAATTQAILRLESELHAVSDPAGGSTAVELATADLAAEAWDRFAALERAGGMVEALRRGEPQKRCAETAAERRARLEEGRDVLVGVTRYPPPPGLAPPPAQPLDRDAVLAAAGARAERTGAAPWWRASAPGTAVSDEGHAETAAPITVMPLVEARDAEPFEADRETGEGVDA